MIILMLCNVWHPLTHGFGDFTDVQMFPSPPPHTAKNNMYVCGGGGGGGWVSWEHMRELEGIY